MVTESHDCAARRSRQGIARLPERSADGLALRETGTSRARPPSSHRIRACIGSFVGVSRRVRLRRPSIPAHRSTSTVIEPLHWQVRREIRSDPARRNSALADRFSPRQPPRGEADKRYRIGLNHIRRRTPGMGRTGDTLNRPKRRNPHLHRTARSLAPQGVEQRADRVAQLLPPGLLTCVKHRNHGGHSVRIGTTRGHARTIRFDTRAYSAGPGSRDGLWTRHSCLRCILLGDGTRLGIVEGAWA